MSEFNIKDFDILLHEGCISIMHHYIVKHTSKEGILKIYMLSTFKYIKDDGYISAYYGKLGAGLYVKYGFKIMDLIVDTIEKLEKYGTIYLYWFHKNNTDPNLKIYIPRDIIGKPICYVDKDTDWNNYENIYCKKIKRYINSKTFDEYVDYVTNTELPNGLVIKIPIEIILDGEPETLSYPDEINDILRLQILLPHFELFTDCTNNFKNRTDGIIKYYDKLIKNRLTKSVL